MRLRYCFLVRYKEKSWFVLLIKLLKIKLLYIEIL